MWNPNEHGFLVEDTTKHYASILLKDRAGNTLEFIPLNIDAIIEVSVKGTVNNVSSILWVDRDSLKYYLGIFANGYQEKRTLYTHVYFAI